MFVLSMKRKRSLIIKLNNNRPKTDHCGTPLAISFQSLYEEFFFFSVYDFISSCVLNLNQSDTCDRLQISQQVDHVVSNCNL